MQALAAPLAELRGVHAAAAPQSSTVVLRGVDLQLAPGEQVAVIGASGSGKTTLLQVLACALPPLRGEFSLFAAAPWRSSSGERQRLRARLCLAPQVPPLPPRQRVVVAVLAGRLPVQSLWASLRTLWHPREAPLAQAALAALDLEHTLWQRVDRLSGGERQRVGLARLLVSDAALWLVDEPLSALDPVRSELAIARLIDAAREAGRTLVCSLHQVEVARRRFPRIVALRDGVVVYDGPAGGLSDEQVRELYGSDSPDAAAPLPASQAAPATAGVPQAMCR
ncbi:phosphonate ABC transporter ATP-binding protein [Methylibium sp.]|uniref:phosphonate ABC transporter ATP-binding protein n=1 Tax=Methylibium sp. TaxID=2067992 RepID=UPI003D0D3C19